MEASPGIVAALAALHDAPARQRTCADDELVADLVAMEELGRLVDARRVALAAEVEDRSRPMHGERDLAFRYGARDGANLVADTARISVMEANRRVGLGAHLASRLTMAGDLVPGRYSEVAAGVATGEIGLESARLLIEALKPIRRRVKTPGAADAAERALAGEARRIGPDLLRTQIEAWTLRLDPDGSRPPEDETHQQRAFRIHRTRSDGMTGFSGMLPPEQAAVVKQVLADHRKATLMVRTVAGDEDTDCIEQQTVEAEGTKRTKSQWDFDTFYSTFSAGVRAEQTGAAGAARTPHEVIVHATAAELDAVRGTGWTSGLLARLPMPTIERLSCSGTVRLLTTDDEGEPLHLGHAVRLFSPAQKKALTARWGGCGFPGCTAPATWCDAHHIRWWHADSGPTDIGNGILLCSHHHHLVHTDDAAFRIVLHDRKPHLIRRGWRGPPTPEQRIRPRALSTDPAYRDPVDILRAAGLTPWWATDQR